MYDKPENATLSRPLTEIEFRPGHYYPKGTFTPADEATVRDIVGAPTPEEEKFCVCGELIEECDEGYVHMTSGA
tara:strand:+ start:1310 stop:1531 length:222 start_codon:yes stop_codon:yes gene_type:complete